MKHKGLIISACLAVALVLGAGIAPALAYFTDTTTSSGSIAIKVRPTTHITEEYDGAKHVVIGNDASSMQDVVVRAKVYAPALVGFTAQGTDWAEGAGGWYLYGKAVEPGQDAAELTVALDWTALYNQEKNPTESDFGESYNVVVVYESLPASDATVDELGNVTAFPTAWA